MASVTRRALLSAAGLCMGGAAALGPTRASADILSTIFGQVERGERADGDTSVGGGDAGAGLPDGLPDWSGLSADEVVSVAVDAILTRDFDTLLTLCAVEDFLDSQIVPLGVIRQLRDDAALDWAPDWQARGDVRPRGLLRMLLATRLRALYAADFLRFLATVAADAAGADVWSFSRDDPSGNIGQQLVALDEALRAFDALELEVLGAWACDSLEEAAELGWISVNWELFAGGRELAAALDPETGYDFRAYCLSVGLDGAEQLRFVLPLCRYGDVWRIQRPLPYESFERTFWYAGDSELPVCDDAHGVELPGFGTGDGGAAAVEYEPAASLASPAGSSTFADADAATAAVLDALWPEGGWEQRDDYASERAFVRLFCADEYLSTVDLAGMYAETLTLRRTLRNYLSIGSIGSFFATSATFLPVAVPGYRTLCAWALASEHGALPLVRTDMICVRASIGADLAPSPTMLQMLEAFSPLPVNINPMMARESLFGIGEDSERLRQAFMQNEFSFAAIGDYLERLNAFWEGYGKPAFAYVACDDITLEAMADIESYVGGTSEDHQVLLYDDATGAWQPLRFVVSACAGGVRVSDIELLAVMSGMLPIMVQPQGIESLAEMTPADIQAAVSAGMFGEEVRDVVAL